MITLFLILIFFIWISKTLEIYKSLHKLIFILILTFISTLATELFITMTIGYGNKELIDSYTIEKTKDDNIYYINKNGNITYDKYHSKIIHKENLDTDLYLYEIYKYKSLPYEYLFYIYTPWANIYDVVKYENYNYKLDKYKQEHDSVIIVE